MKNHPSSSKLTAMVIAVLGLAIAPESQAALIAYDGFADGGSTVRATANPLGQYQTSPASTNGTNNAALSGQAPVLTGFSGSNAWSNSGGVNGTVHPRAAAGGLTYTNLVTTSGQADIFRSGTGGPDVKGANRSATTSDTSSVQWVSMLLYQDTAKLMTVSPQWTTDGGSLSFGLNASQQAFFTSSGPVVDRIDQTSTTTFTLDTTHMFLLKLELGVVTGPTNANRYDRITLWVDPNLSLGEAGLGTGLVGQGIVRVNTSNTTIPLTRLSFSADPSNETFIFDEFRVGTTFNDVAPIPEPTTFAMLLGGLGLLMFRRSRGRIVG